VRVNQHTHVCVWSTYMCMRVSVPLTCPCSKFQTSRLFYAGFNVSSCSSTRHTPHTTLHPQPRPTLAPFTRYSLNFSPAPATPDARHPLLHYQLQTSTCVSCCSSLHRCIMPTVLVLFDPNILICLLVSHKLMDVPTSRKTTQLHPRAPAARVATT